MTKTHHGACCLQMIRDESRDNKEESLEDRRRRLKDVGLKVSRSETEYLLPKESSADIELKEYDSSDYVTLHQKVTFKYLGTGREDAGQRCKWVLAEPGTNGGS